MCASVFVDVWGTNGRWGSGKTTFHIPQGWIGLPILNPSTSVKVFYLVSVKISSRNTRSKWNNPHGHRFTYFTIMNLSFWQWLWYLCVSVLKAEIHHDQAKIHKLNPIDKNGCPEISAADWISPCIHTLHRQHLNCICISVKKYFNNQGKNDANSIHDVSRKCEYVTCFLKGPLKCLALFNVLT